ncbi:hypothetical protein SNE40_016445 [Patella caerulea]|uniref:Uncharacterized protein n=1 Tax=Patella caerulea TaxID=87958 RepID=A0AAN8PC60_PATCE
MKLLFVVAAVAAVWLVEAQQNCRENHECAAVIHCQAHEEYFCDVRDGRCACRDRHFVGKRQQHHCRDHAECDHGQCNANSEGFCDEHGICGCRDLPHCGDNRDCGHLMCGAHEEAFCDDNHGCHCRGKYVMRSTQDTRIKPCLNKRILL